MTFTKHQNFETQASGTADWDSGLNANATIAERGYHVLLTAGTAINSGDILWASSGALVFPYNPNSFGLGRPIGMSYKAVSSGEADHFLFEGIVNSMSTVWSGKIIPGEPVYASTTTPGFAVSSYGAAAFPVGYCLDRDTVLVSPDRPRVLPEYLSRVNSLGQLVVGSVHRFTIDVGRRGIVRRLEYRATSVNLFTLKLYSGSSAVNSELLYETKSGGVASFFMRDQAMFPYEVTDNTSWSLIHGRLDVTSGGGVGSGHINIALEVERIR